MERCQWTRLYLTGDILVKSDRMAMMHSVDGILQHKKRAFGIPVGCWLAEGNLQLEETRQSLFDLVRNPRPVAEQTDGLLAELILRVYYEFQSKTDCRVKSILMRGRGERTMLRHPPHASSRSPVRSVSDSIM